MIQLKVSKALKSLHLSFSFQANSNRIVLFGPSGSGKTLLLKMIAGFFDPDNGKITINDTSFFDAADNASLPIHQRNIGYLPQEYTLFPNMNVCENILYGLKARKLALDKTHFQYLIERLGISNTLDSYPSQLSGGQQQRAALARSLMVSPDVLLLDEPFSALDSSIRESLRDLVIDIADEFDITTLFVTHDLEEAFIFGREIVLVNKGKVLEYGPKEQVYYRPNFAETASLLGFINIWPIASQKDNIVTTEFGTELSCRGKFDPSASFCCIRPENIMFLREDRPFKEAIKKNILPGVISSIHNRGHYMNVEMVTPEGMILSINIPEHAFNHMKLEKDKFCKVSLKEESIILCRTLSEGNIVIER